MVNIGELVTMQGPNRARKGLEMKNLVLVPDGALVIQAGRIVAAGPVISIEIPASAEVIDAGGRMVTPGLIDAHAHPIFAGNRAAEFDMRCQGASYQEIAAAGGGIRSTVKATRQATEKALLRESLEHVNWMVRNGTTTAEAKSGYGLDVETELKMLRVIQRISQDGPIELVPTFLGAHAAMPEFDEDHVRCMREFVLELLPKVAHEGLAEFADIFVEERYFTPACAEMLANSSKTHGLGLRMHVDQLTNSGGAALAARLGAKTADHLEQTEEEGIAALATTATQPVLLPGSVYGLGLLKYPDARAMIESGLPVVLATDFNPGSSPSPSLPMALSLACTQMRMTPAECLVACTVNAAASLNRLHDRGTLEPGKRADLVIWDCDDYREIPYWFGIELANSVYVEGNCVFER